MTHFDGSVLVLGATGATGQLVVAALKAKAIQTRALVRDAAKAEDLAKMRVGVVVGSVLDTTHLEVACWGTTAVICTLGAKNLHDLEEMEAIEQGVMANLVEMAERNRLKHIVFCTSLGTTTPERIPFLANILRAKRRGEVILENSGIPYTIVRPGGLTDGPGGEGVLICPELSTSGMITRADVAEVLVQALLQPAAQNKIVEIINQPGEPMASDPMLFARLAMEN